MNMMDGLATKLAITSKRAREKNDIIYQALGMDKDLEEGRTGVYIFVGLGFVGLSFLLTWLLMQIDLFAFPVVKALMWFLLIIGNLFIIYGAIIAPLIIDHKYKQLKKGT